MQKHLLIWLQRLAQRSDIYSKRGRYYYKCYDRLIYKPVLKHKIHNQLHAQKNKSISTAVQALTKVKTDFLIELDLKDAFPSVKTETLLQILNKIFLDECRAYFYPVVQKKFCQKILEISEIIKEKIGRPPTYKIIDYASEEEKWEIYQQDLNIWNDRVNELLKNMGYDGIEKHWDNSWIAEDPQDHWSMPWVTMDSYPHYPLFSTPTCREFRKLLRTTAQAEINLSDSQIPEIIKLFTKYLVKLITLNNSLPQGAPTSGFLLNLVISEMHLPEKIIESLNSINRSNVFGSGKRKSRPANALAIYADNFFITSLKKPNGSLLTKLKAIITATEIFQLNSKKTKVYDLRSNSAPLLGAKLIQRSANKKELKKIEKEWTAPRGYAKAKRTNRPWLIMTASLSRKKQKQYRAFLYRVLKGLSPAEEISRAEGYHGHIVSVYGPKIENLPATLRDVVQNFRDKFHKHS